MAMNHGNEGQGSPHPTEDDLTLGLAAMLAGQLRLADTDALTPAARLDDVGLDSLGLLSFVASIEREFGVSVSDSDYEGLTTFADVVALVERLTRA